MFKSDKSLAQGTLLNFTNPSPSASTAFSNDFLNNWKMEDITRNRMDGDNSHIFIPWSWPSMRHGSDHHRAIGDVQDHHTPWLEQCRIGSLVCHDRWHNIWRSWSRVLRWVWQALNWLGFCWYVVNAVSRGDKGGSARVTGRPENWVHRLFARCNVDLLFSCPTVQGKWALKGDFYWLRPRQPLGGVGLLADPSPEELKTL